ncbi:MAG: low molecular weight phosphatase family protein [Candidatus Acidiferrales bacterium]|jgi:arsenate reductase
MKTPVRVLFVCVGNCVRSQMAEAIARHSYADIILPESAGVSPLGFIDTTTQAVLREHGIPFDGQFSKGLHNHKLRKPDVVINMSGIHGKALFPEHDVEDWKVRDPFGEDIELHRTIFNDIEARVTLLAARLRTRAVSAD